MFIVKPETIQIGKGIETKHAASLEEFVIKIEIK